MFFIIQYIVPPALAFMMFNIGITISLPEIRNIARFPKAFALGALLQIISLPLLAIIIALLVKNFFSLPDEVILGILILAVCPGGVTSNILTMLGNGNLALSITLTSLLSFVGILTVPLFFAISNQLVFGESLNLNHSFLRITLGIFVFTTIPISLGLLFRHFRSDLALRYEKKFRPLTFILFMLIVVAALIKNKNILLEHIDTLAPIALLFNAIVMFIAIIAVKVFKLDLRNRIAIVFECGSQNTGLAVLIALNVLQIEQAGVFAAVYTPIMYLTAFIYYYYIRPTNKHNLNSHHKM